MKRKTILCILLLCLAMLAGCAKDQNSTAKPAAKELVVGYSQLGSESAYRLGSTRSMTEAAERYGMGLMLENANQKQEKQIEALRSFIAYRVDVIALSPIVETGWDNVLQEAKDAGIPVILVDRSIDTKDDSLYVSCIGSNFYQQGIQAGEFLRSRAELNGSDHLNIVEISGTIDSTPMRERQRGFADTISGDSRFTMLESISGDFLRSKGKECMEYLLTKYGSDIDVLYSHNDSMTLGAVEVIEAAGLQPGKDIIIISVDAEQDAIDLLKDGKINCIVECTPFLGDLVMQTAISLANGETVERMIYPDEHVFLDTDDLSDLGPRGY